MVEEIRGRVGAELRQWLRQPAAWLILLVGALLSLFAWRSLQLEVEYAARSSFNETVAGSRNAIESRLRDAEIIIHGLQGLFQSGEVDRIAFRRYVDSLRPASGLKYLRGFSFARRVSVTNTCSSR